MSNPIFDSIRFMRKYILQLLWFSVPLFSITIIFEILLIFADNTGLLDANNFVQLGNILHLIVLPFLSGGLLILVASLSAGESLTTREILKKISPLWIYYILLMFSMYIMIFMGLFLYLIPGLWLILKFVFAQPILVFEKKTPVDALVESFKRTGAPMSKLIFTILPVMAIIGVMYVYMFYLMGFRIEGSKPIVPKSISMYFQVMMYFMGLSILLFTNILQFRLYQMYGQSTDEMGSQAK
ncbi:hypothetical protein MNBD_GAMMA12-243 [hydrothermal vent metagenome]|uniref:Glycerophosphoryl diester phosphodiesterase membrane domain-containing protein n=1 Tax=hydrothermal vent metagenome TaxID=652676 RepID=A0A3B0Z6W0_9ZZZZ